MTATFDCWVCLVCLEKTFDKLKVCTEGYWRQSENNIDVNKPSPRLVPKQQLHVVNQSY